MYCDPSAYSAIGHTVLYTVHKSTECTEVLFIYLFILHLVTGSFVYCVLYCTTGGGDAFLRVRNSRIVLSCTCQTRSPRRWRGSIVLDSDWSTLIAQFVLIATQPVPEEVSPPPPPRPQRPPPPRTPTAIPRGVSRHRDAPLGQRRAPRAGGGTASVSGVRERERPGESVFLFFSADSIRLCMRLQSPLTTSRRRHPTPRHSHFSPGTQARKISKMSAKLIALATVAASLGLAAAECPNACSGHGSGSAFDMCTCHSNWQGADCSLATCQYGYAHATTPQGDKNMDGDRNDNSFKPLSQLGTMIVNTDKLYFANDLVAGEIEVNGGVKICDQMFYITAVDSQKKYTTDHVLAISSSTTDTADGVVTVKSTEISLADAGNDKFTFVTESIEPNFFEVGTMWWSPMVSPQTQI